MSELVAHFPSCGRPDRECECQRRPEDKTFIGWMERVGMVDRTSDKARDAE